MKPAQYIFELIGNHAARLRDVDFEAMEEGEFACVEGTFSMNSGETYRVRVEVSRDFAKENK